MSSSVHCQPYADASQGLPISHTVEFSSYQFFEQKSPSNGKSARESCCLLGGGVVHDDTNPFRDELIGWKIDIYGHEQVDTQAPTKSPSSIGVINPPSIDVTTAAPGNRGIGSSAKSLASSALLFAIVTVSVALLL